MEKFQAGQIYVNGKTTRKIADGCTWIRTWWFTEGGYLKSSYKSTFENWVTRTGAKLEGIDGE